MMLETRVISLNTEGGRTRMKDMGVHLDKLGLQYQVIRGVHGKMLTPEERLAVATPICARWCTPSTIGCAASHVLAWRDAVSSGRPYTLILEDDTELDPDTPKILKRLLPRLPKDADVLLLGCYLCATDPRRGRSGETIGMKRIRQFSGTHAYIITQKGARVLLEYATPIKYHLDRIMSILNYSGQLVTYALTHDIAKQANGEATSENVGETPGFPNVIYDATRHVRDGKGQSIYFLLAMPAFEAWGVDVTVLDGIVFLLGVFGMSPAVFTSLVAADSLVSWRARGLIKSAVLFLIGRIIYLLWQ
jgi:GR25 family glycosyltransferase involved in LPS biosynthesis